MTGRKMNYLFVMPRYIQTEGAPYMFPLGIAYVSSSLKQIRDTVYNLNLNANMDSLKQNIEHAILKNNIDVLLVGGLSPHFNQIHEIVDIAKKVRPDIVTVAGGGGHSHTQDNSCRNS